MRKWFADFIIWWNTYVLGTSQFARKTTYALVCDFQPVFDQGLTYQSFKDPHADGAARGAGYALAYGHPDNIVIIDLNRRGLVTSPGLALRSTHPQLQIRIEENREHARFFAATASLPRKAAIEDTRIIQEWFFTMVEGWANTPLAFHMPPQAMRSLLRPGSEPFQRVVPHIENEDVRLKLQTLPDLLRNPHYAQLFQAVLRFIDELWREPAVCAMLQATFDLLSLVRRQGQLFILGGKNPVINSWVFNSIERLETLIARSHYEQHGEQNPFYMRSYLDELGRYASPLHGADAAETLKMKKSHLYINQTPSLGDEDLEDQIDSNCLEKIMMNAGSEKVAQYIRSHLRLRLDPHKISHHTERTINTGYREIETTSEGVSRGSDGKVRSHDTRKGKSYQPIQSTVRDPHYRSLNDQGMLHEQAAMELGPGQYYRRFGNQLTGPHDVPAPEDPWVWDGSAQDAIERHIAYQMDMGITRSTLTQDQSWLNNIPIPVIKVQPKPKVPLGGNRKNGSSNGSRTTRARRN